MSAISIHFMLELWLCFDIFDISFPPMGLGQNCVVVVRLVKLIDFLHICYDELICDSSFVMVVENMFGH